MRAGSRRTLRALLPGLALGALLFAQPAVARAQAGLNWQPDERVVISDFGTIVGIAVDAWRVYAATPYGLLRYDPALQRWELPLTREDGYPELEGVSALTKLSDGTLVLGTRLGTLYTVEPEGGRFDPLASVPGGIVQLHPGPFGALLAGTTAGWFQLERGSFFPQPIASLPSGSRPPTDARMAALRGTLGLDARLRRWPLTVSAAGTRADEYWIGTDGAGLLHVDARTLTVEPVPFGVSTAAVTAMALVNGRLWFGGSGPARGRSTITTSDSALQHWAVPGRANDDVPTDGVSSILPHTGDVWVGTGSGLFRWRTVEASWRRFDRRDGLPGDRVTAMATGDSALWIGTQNGACLWQQDRCGPPLLPGLRVTALARCAGHLWIGTDAGLWQVEVEEGRRLQGELGGARIQGLACTPRGLYAATPQALYAYADGAWKGPVTMAARGTLRALNAHAGELWVVGDGGLARWNEAAERWTYYIVTGDVSRGTPWGILPDDSRIWLLTAGGAVRLEGRAP